jgi:hypothetical protein
MPEASGTRFNVSGQRLRNAIFVPLVGTFMCLSVHESSAAIRFKRFPHCPEGLITKKTCECHAGTSGRFHFCHAGESCDLTHGFCHK